jgi:putative DNA primase/helicase
VAPAPKLDSFPTDLRSQRRWVAWRYVTRRGKTMKKPLQSITKPPAWLSVTQACDFVARGAADGVGFVLGEGVVGIDLDDCLDLDGTLHEIAQDAIALGTYIERSPSGRGLHALIRASISEPRNIAAEGNISRHEIYDGRKGSARYLTVTGNRVGDASGIREGPQAQAALDAFYAKWFSEESEWLAPSCDAATVWAKPLEDDELVEVMFRATDGAKWRRLFEGDHSGHPSQSEADFQLLRKLRFYSRADRAQMDRLFRHSGLMRPKWDERRGEQTYGERTISKAIAGGGRVYRRAVSRFRSGAFPGQFGILHLSVYPVLSRLTKTDILTYGALAIHAKNGECYPSAARIAKLAGTTREHAQTSIGKLEAVGLISVGERPGETSIIRLLAFRGVSTFDTPSVQPGRATSAPRLPSNGRRQRLRRSTEPVSGLDTPPVSNFDTQTDKEQSIGTGERGAGTSEDDELKLAEKVIVFPDPCVPLSQSARLLRDEMLRGPVGQFFLDGDAQPDLRL